MPMPEYSPQSTTVSEVGVEGRDELEGGGDDASPAAVSRCAGEQKSGESELCAPVIRWAPVGEQRRQEEVGMVIEVLGRGHRGREVVLAHVAYSQVSAHVANPSWFWHMCPTPVQFRHMLPTPRFRYMWPTPLGVGTCGLLPRWFRYMWPTPRTWH